LKKYEYEISFGFKVNTRNVYEKTHEIVTFWDRAEIRKILQSFCDN